MNKRRFYRPKPQPGTGSVLSGSTDPSLAASAITIPAKPISPPWQGRTKSGLTIPPPVTINRSEQSGGARVVARAGASSVKQEGGLEPTGIAHPQVAGERIVAEDFIVDRIHSRFGKQCKLYDVGGNYGGTARALKRITTPRAIETHVMSPITQEADVMREQDLRVFKRSVVNGANGAQTWSTRNPKVTGCNHMLRDCTCYTGTEPRHFMLCHSLYYMTPEDLRVFRVGDIIWVVVHVFGTGLEANGTIGGNEYTWVKREGVITMTPTAGGTEYIHEDANYKLNKKRYRWTDDTGAPVYLTSNLELSRGDTRVYRCAVASERFRAATPPAVIQPVEVRMADTAVVVSECKDDLVDPLDGATKSALVRILMSHGAEYFTASAVERLKKRNATVVSICRVHNCRAEDVLAYCPEAERIVFAGLKKAVQNIVRTEDAGRAVDDVLKRKNNDITTPWLCVVPLLVAYALNTQVTTTTILLPQYAALAVISCLSYFIVAKLWITVVLRRRYYQYSRTVQDCI